MLHDIRWHVRLHIQVGLIAARRTGRLRGTKQVTGKSDRD